MRPRPDAGEDSYRGCGKLKGKRALITGGDSGIGRAVALAYAREGASVAIVYLDEHKDAEETRRMVEEAGAQCLLLSGDIGFEPFCVEAVQKTVEAFGGLDILVNNAAEQHVQEDITGITSEQLERTFRTNILSMFYLTKAAVEHMDEGSAIVNSTSVTAYRGSEHLLDYSSTKGAIVSFTRSLSKALAKRKIRVNAVAPGPVWTPLIPASFPPEKVAKFGKDTFLGRPAEPIEIAPSYVFLAAGDSSFMTGQVLHPNGGEMVES
jgi:NAD(P)-dependent dehydrogenase (short-subunit alcohol dehydrogenase family)